MKRDVWESARLEYITSDCSQRDIVEKYGVSATAVASRATKEKWTQEREKYKCKINAEVTKKMAAKKAKKYIQLSAAAENLAKVAHKKSKHILKAAQEAEKTGNPDAWTLVNAKEVLCLAETTRKLTETMIEIHGRPQTDEADRTVRVILGGEAEDFAK